VQVLGTVFASHKTYSDVFVRPTAREFKNCFAGGLVLDDEFCGKGADEDTLKAGAIKKGNSSGGKQVFVTGRGGWWRSRWKAEVIQNFLYCFGFLDCRDNAYWAATSLT
jgi:hypothetical protein